MKSLPIFIARRYFFSGKKKNFINVISIISMVVVAIGTAALVIVLSVFNGMESLLRSIYGSFDAELLITASEGKSFQTDQHLLNKIRSIEGIESITEVIEDQALIKYNEAQMVVKLKGMSSNDASKSRILRSIVEGDHEFIKDNVNYAIIGRGIYYALSISMKNDFYPLQIFYPKNVKPGTIDPSKYYKRGNIMTGGVFALEQHYDDNYVLVPLKFAEKLFDYEGRRTALEINLNGEVSDTDIQASLIDILGPNFNVYNGDEQHSDLYKVLKIEKLFVFIIFSLVIGIASINIFFTLSMLVIEKRPDIAILHSMGTSQKVIRKIFLTEGAIIAFTGAGSGLVLGLLLALGQQHFGLISMGTQSAVVDAYPVKLVLSDFVFICLVIVLITFTMSILPSVRASKPPDIALIK